MGRRIALALLASAFVAVGSLPASAASEGLRIREIETSGFPAVEVTVAFEEPVRIRPGDVTITENGTPAGRSIAVRSLEQSGQTVDVVLVVDTSGSMEGQALASAQAAALRFITGLPETVRVGIVTFADKPKVLHPLSDDTSGALKSLASLEARGETALYDAVVAGARMLTGSAQRNLIVLSDGGDTASRGSLADAVGAAKKATAAVFPVGLRTSETDVGALRTMASRTGGAYAPARSSDLGSIYEGLAAELSNQYVVTYRSASKGGEVSLAVSAAGASDAALVAMPRPPAPAPRPEAEAPAGPGFGLVGSVGLTLALALTFLGVFVVGLMMLGAGVRRRRDRGLAERMAATPGSGSKDAEEAPGLRAFVPEPLVFAGEKMAEVGGFADRLDHKLERAGVALRSGEFVVGSAGAAMVAALFGGVILGGPVFAFAFAAVAAMIPSGILSFGIRRRSNKLHAQLADVLMLLASSLRAGHSFLQALDMVAQEIDDPGAQEFGRVVAEIRLGRDTAEALEMLAERVDSDDFRWAVMAVNVQREVGGNLAEVLDTVADTVRERDAVRGQVRVLSAEGRMSAGILTALPFLVALYVAKMNPGYLNVLFTTRIGIVMVVAASCLLIVGVLWMRKMVKIDV